RPAVAVVRGAVQVAAHAEGQQRAAGGGEAAEEGALVGRRQAFPAGAEVAGAQQGAGLAEQEQLPADLENAGDVAVELLVEHRLALPAQAAIEGFQVVAEGTVDDEALAAEMGDAE